MNAMLERAARDFASIWATTDRDGRDRRPGTCRSASASHPKRNRASSISTMAILQKRRRHDGVWERWLRLEYRKKFNAERRGACRPRDALMSRSGC